MEAVTLQTFGSLAIVLLEDLNLQIASLTRWHFLCGQNPFKDEFIALIFL